VDRESAGEGGEEEEFLEHGVANYQV
jgi:hypothetical protein